MIVSTRSVSLENKDDKVQPSHNENGRYLKRHDYFGCSKDDVIRVTKKKIVTRRFTIPPYIIKVYHYKARV